jgi:hypothetical protein
MKLILNRRTLFLQFAISDHSRVWYPPDGESRLLRNIDTYLSIKLHTATSQKVFLNQRLIPAEETPSSKLLVLGKS